MDEKQYQPVAPLSIIDIIALLQLINNIDDTLLIMQPHIQHICDHILEEPDSVIINTVAPLQQLDLP